MKKRVIPAEVHSDDQHISLQFDARTWFAKASLQQIEALKAINWGGDYSADSVAEYYATRTTKPLFDYLATKPKMGRDTVGFECHVNKWAALEWLKTHRPTVFQAIAPQVYKTVITVTVLSEKRIPDSVTLQGISEEIDTGSWIGAEVRADPEIVTGEDDIRKELRAMRNDEHFFDALLEG